jgi:hypothetical protein
MSVVSMSVVSMLGDSMENRPQPGPSSDTPIERYPHRGAAFATERTQQDSDEGGF